MKDINENRDLKKAFGQTPEDFERMVARTLKSCKEEKKMKKNAFRFVLVLTILTLLLLGTAYAASRLGYLSDMFGKSYGIEHMATDVPDAPIATYEVGGVRIELEELIADGKYLYLNALCSSAVGDAIVYTSAYESNSPMSAGGMCEDKRTFVEVAKEQGKRLYQCGIYAYSMDETCSTDMLDGIPHPEDGTMNHITTGAFPTEDAQMDIRLEFIVHEVNLDNPETYQDGDMTFEAYPFYEGRTQRHNETMTVPVSQPLGTCSIGLSGQRLEASGVTLERLELTRTPMTTYYELIYTTDKTPDEWQFELDFADKQGERIKGGTSLGGWQVMREGLEQMRTGSLDLESIPDELSIGVYDWEKNDWAERVTFKTH